MVVLSDKDIINTDEAPEYLIKGSLEPTKAVFNIDSPLKDARDEFEKQYIISALRVTGWNVTKASKILDIERTYLHRKMKSYGLDRGSYE